MDHSLSTLYQQLADLSARYGTERLVLFSSRARNDFTRTSDIDLAVYGMPQENQGGFWWEAEALPTLLNSISSISSQAWIPPFSKTLDRME